MSEPRHAARAARFLRAQRNAGKPVPTDPGQAIAGLALAIGAAHRRRRVRRLVSGGGAVVVAAAIVVGTQAWRRAVPPTTRAPLATPDRPSAAQASPPVPSTWAAGSPIHAGTAARTLTDADGTTIRLLPGTEMSVVRSDRVRWLALERGKLEAHVTKLAPGQRFVVATADREIEVRGTRFAVEVVRPTACGDGTATRVTVEEGIVEVRSPGGAGEQLRAGARWPLGCGGPATPGPTGARGVPARPSGSKSEPAASTLESENDLLARAIRAARAGDRAAALEELDRLLDRYPASPLRQAVAAERERLLRQVDPRAAP